MPIQFVIDWDNVHEIIDWCNSIGWAALLAYEVYAISKRPNKRILEESNSLQRK